MQQIYVNVHLCFLTTVIIFTCQKHFRRPKTLNTKVSHMAYGTAHTNLVTDYVKNILQM